MNFFVRKYFNFLQPIFIITFMLFTQSFNVKKFCFSSEWWRGLLLKRVKRGGTFKETLESKIWDMGCLNSPFYVSFSKGCLPTILVDPFLKPLPLM